MYESIRSFPHHKKKLFNIQDTFANFEDKVKYFVC